MGSVCVIAISWILKFLSCWENHDKITASTLILLHDLSTGKLKPSCLRRIFYILLYLTKKKKAENVWDLKTCSLYKKQSQGYLKLIGNEYIHDPVVKSYWFWNGLSVLSLCAFFVDYVFLSFPKCRCNLR
jgi:hypothetical protein